MPDRASLDPANLQLILDRFPPDRRKAARLLLTLSDPADAATPDAAAATIETIPRGGVSRADKAAGRRLPHDLDEIDRLTLSDDDVIALLIASLHLQRIRTTDGAFRLLWLYAGRAVLRHAFGDLADPYLSTSITAPDGAPSAASDRRKAILQVLTHSPTLLPDPLGRDLKEMLAALNRAVASDHEHAPDLLRPAPPKLRREALRAIEAEVVVMIEWLVSQGVGRGEVEDAVCQEFGVERRALRDWRRRAAKADGGTYAGWPEYRAGVTGNPPGPSGRGRRVRKCRATADPLHAPDRARIAEIATRWRALGGAGRPRRRAD